jgi:hypothetical protein
VRLYTWRRTGLADEVGSDAIPDAAGGEGGHGAAKPEGVIHRCLFNIYPTKLRLGDGEVVRPCPLSPLKWLEHTRLPMATLSNSKKSREPVGSRSLHTRISLHLTVMDQENFQLLPQFMQLAKMASSGSSALLV